MRASSLCFAAAALVLAGAASPALAATQVGPTSTETVALPQDSVPLAKATATYTHTLEGCYMNDAGRPECRYSFVVELSVEGVPSHASTGDADSSRLHVIHPYHHDPLADPVGYATHPSHDAARYGKKFWPNEEEFMRGYVEYPLYVCLYLQDDEGHPTCAYWTHRVPVHRPEPVPPCQTQQARGGSQAEAQAEATMECGATTASMAAGWIPLQLPGGA